MLVLTRKAHERIQIGDQVVITILQVKGQSVRVGIEAPRDVLVLRAELPKHETAPENATAKSNDRAGFSSTRRALSSTRRTAAGRLVNSNARSSPVRGRSGSDSRHRYPDRSRSLVASRPTSLAPRPEFLNHL